MGLGKSRVLVGVPSSYGHGRGHSPETHNVNSQLAPRWQELGVSDLLGVTDAGLRLRKRVVRVLNCKGEVVRKTLCPGETDNL